MRTHFFTFLIFLMMSLYQGAHISYAGSTLGHATATIQEHLSITNKTPLDFGVIEQGGGTVTITPLNQRHVDGSVKISETESYDRASVTVNGRPDMVYSITMPKTLQFTKEGASPVEGITSLTVKDLKSYSKNNQSQQNKGKLDAQGLDTVYVGGTLVVPAGAEPGRYRGEVIISVSY